MFYEAFSAFFTEFTVGRINLPAGTTDAVYRFIVEAVLDCRGDIPYRGRNFASRFIDYGNGFVFYVTGNFPA